MFTGKEIKLFKIFGVEITIDYSWFWIFFLVFWSFSFSILPALKSGLSLKIYLPVGLLATLLFFASILAHELAHTLVAIRNNININKITLFLFGGVSNLTSEPKTPLVEIKMAAAGPAASVIIGIVLILISALSPLTTQSNILLIMLNTIGTLNLGLAIFNLLPGFPLDGGRILRALLWRKTNNFKAATRSAALSGQVLGIFIIAAGFVQFLFTGLIGSLWLSLIGFFLYSAAKVSALSVNK